MHYFFSMLFSLLAIIGPVSVQSAGRRAERSSDRSYRSVLKVSNGGPWGSWGVISMCPSGTYVDAFSLKVEGKLIFGGDDTALNGIRLYCVDRPGADEYTAITSDVGGWGEWTDKKSCPVGFFTAFQLKVESPRGSGDDTAANSIDFKCSDWVIWGKGLNWGDWGDWSATCEGKGICGLQTRVEESQGSEGDDTALNDVIMFCCD
ncbi:vitelline membrane outer layer protein 1-like [Rhinichthys klamathensis goyatoka]|uniref:vitelline membrane outer layer protein 1-like n=1 Tax=Rhinichthys klamathensis goyatoka TaxID=3034132 RepID=UPI0024B5F4E9|nr:vitelline membrane outer layer protein 1-like [Rhinichthys klamathensis goyatoka]